MSRGWLGSTFLVLLLPWAAGCRDDQPAPDVAPSRLNVVVVVLDAARADHFGAYGYDRDTTPHVSRFALRATRYQTVVSEASFTFLSTSSLFAAASPATTGLGARMGGRVPDEMELIAETAAASGYGTYGYSENPYVTDYFGLAQGFDLFDEAFPTSDLQSGRELVSAADGAARLGTLVAKAAADRDRPFFLYAHLLRPHNPYAPSSDFAGRFGSVRTERSVGSTAALLELDRRGGPFGRREIERIVALYDENLAEGDALFGVLLDCLDRAGVRNETIVVLTADHGEAFGEHGRLLHSTQLYDPMLRVPLLIDVPGAPAGVVETPIQLADLGRGLRALFQGIPAATDGLRRLGSERDPAAPLYSWTNAKTHHLAARTGDRRLIVDMKSRAIVAYHDRRADPQETRSIPLDAVGEAMLAGVERELDRWIGERPAGASEPGASLSVEKRRQLEALGYLQP